MAASYRNYELQNHQDYLLDFHLFGLVRQNTFTFYHSKHSFLPPILLPFWLCCPGRWPHSPFLLAMPLIRFFFSPSWCSALFNNGTRNFQSA